MIVALGWLFDIFDSPGIPSPDTILGTWTYDGERSRDMLHQDAKRIAEVEKTFAGALYVLTSGTIAVGTEGEPGVPRPCTMQGHPGDAFVVEITDAGARGKLLFQRDTAGDREALYLSVQGGAIPFKRQSVR